MTTRYSSRTPVWWPVLLAIALAVYPDMATAAEDAAAPPAGGVPATERAAATPQQRQEPGPSDAGRGQRSSGSFRPSRKLPVDSAVSLPTDI